MVGQTHYIETVKEYYSFLISEFSLQVVNEKIKGNVFYDIQYGDNSKIVSISYENIEDYLQIIIFILQDKQLPDYDDKTRTLHLNKLNTIILSKANKNEITLNNEYFKNFKPAGKLENKLLKSAKELRLCLKYFDSIQLSFH